MKNLTLILVVLFWGFVSVCHAADPAITGIVGTLTSGQTIVVSGTNFGAKATAAPIKFENFEDGVNGAVIADTTDWTDYKLYASSNTEDPKYSTTSNRTNSTMNARFHFDVDYVAEGHVFSDCYLIWEGDENLHSKVFVSFWVRWDWGTGGGASFQHKLMRILGDDASTIPSISSFNWSTPSYYWSIQTADGTSSPNELKTGTQPYKEDNWTLVQVSVSGHESTGECQIRYLTPGESQVAQNLTGKTIRDDENWRDFRFGEYHGNSAADAETTFFYDDIYLDKSWARVEVGDNADYASCTHREMQIATAWADGEITFTLNTGSITDLTGGGYYLFVVDADGNPSPGKRLTAGGASPTGQPSISGGGGGGGSW